MPGHCFAERRLGAKLNHRPGEVRIEVARLDAMGTGAIRGTSDLACERRMFDQGIDDDELPRLDVGAYRHSEMGETFETRMLVCGPVGGRHRDQRSGRRVRVAGAAERRWTS